MLKTYLFYLQQLLVVFYYLHLLHQLILGINIFAINAVIKNYKKIIKKKKKKHDKTAFSGKDKLSTL